jgi:hypothetical protein
VKNPTFNAESAESAESAENSQGFSLRTRLVPPEHLPFTYIGEEQTKPENSDGWHVLNVGDEPTGGLDE